ncbi:TPA: hypothetical protein N2C61_003453 [Pseudomonas aeruginosa]|uniref:hypothetical protein n=1 Tax=Pseudomonas aeruginosa TaxID=287 RepID=UPI001A18BA67|nr:hypothetical protein [Pseudomonas aeruginosa]MBH8699206.1 hypothetical protein [Pseudomonas aeruginosa]HCL4132346.1 hypothetical protein [Pseudomonas aeruginosa]HEK3608633.1 hypothetical protein [Pseudomonas aeruginosa]
MPLTIEDQHKSQPSPRWTFACTRCEWTGNNPDSSGLGHYADCPDCGNSCTTDEPSFEPAAGQLDGIQ